MKLKLSFLLLTMVLFTIGVGTANAFDNHKENPRTEDCVILNAEQNETVDVVLTTVSYDFNVYSLEIEKPNSPQVPQINQTGTIERWCKQERIRLCSGFINGINSPPLRG